MNKLYAMALLGHNDSNVRGVALGIVTGLHQQFGILRDALLDAGEQPETLMKFEIGQNYYIETLTKYYIGTVASCDGIEVDLEKAAWVASTGFVTEFMATGRAQNLEVEIVGNISLPLGIITAKASWPHKLWKEAVR